MGMTKDFLSGVVALADEQPARVGQLIRIAWPEIKAAMDRGHTLKVIHQRLLKGGVRVSYRQFTAYVRQFLKNTPAHPSEEPQQRRSAKSTARPKQREKAHVAREDALVHFESIDREGSDAATTEDDPWEPTFAIGSTRID